jgi:hypothetical protein
MASFWAGVIGPLLWVNSWRLISWRMRPSTPANVLSKDCWAPLVLRMDSMLAALGGAANTELVARVKEIRRGLREVFIC